MSLRGHRLSWLAALFAASALGGLAPREASAQGHNFVYVESDNPAGNAIFGFARNNADGSLTPLPGSPLSTTTTGEAPSSRRERTHSVSNGPAA